jgi:hypothetical protein
MTMLRTRCNLRRSAAHLFAHISFMLFSNSQIEQTTRVGVDLVYPAMMYVRESTCNSAKQGTL